MSKISDAADAYTSTWISDAADAYMSTWDIEEEDMSFEVGDVVFLKSGGPSMTVAKLLEDGSVIVNWFGGEPGNPYAACFQPEMLELVDDEDGLYDADDEDDTPDTYEVADDADAEQAELDAIMTEYDRDRNR
jgi:uncharacterized protein YodC (DUF2158 family)